MPNFFRSVKLSDADWIVKENQYLEQNYSFRFAPSKLIEEMDKVEVPKKPVQGIAWYNLMANPMYVRAFNYIEIDVPNRENLIVDGDDNEGNDCEQSDMVNILINLAFVKPKVGREFKLESGYSESFKADMQTSQFQKGDAETPNKIN